MNKKEKKILNKIEESVKSNGDYSKLASKIKINIEPNETKQKRRRSGSLAFAGLFASLLLVFTISIPLILNSNGNKSSSSNNAVQNGDSLNSEPSSYEPGMNQTSSAGATTDSDSTAVESSTILSHEDQNTENDSSSSTAPQEPVIEYNGAFYQLEIINDGDSSFDGLDFEDENVIYLDEIDGFMIYDYYGTLIAIEKIDNTMYYMKLL